MSLSDASHDIHQSNVECSLCVSGPQPALSAIPRSFILIGRVCWWFWALQRFPALRSYISFSGKGFIGTVGLVLFF